MGSIYLAEDNRLPGRVCAVKEIRQDPDIPTDTRAQGREQFYREASVLARLDHPNLPKVSDYFTEGEHDFLVMDFVPGEDLKSLMDKARKVGKQLPVEDVLRWALQLADALDYLHRQQPPVIHRDIKPSNLKLTPSGLIKLVDFGLVKQMVPGEMTITVIQGRGTAYYTPLEQYGGDTGHTDIRSDVYAFGATLYHLLTGHPPPEAKRRFLQPESLRPIREFNPEVDLSVEEAILWAMELHPDERPPDVQAFRQALLGVIDLESQPAPTFSGRFLPKTILVSDLDRALVGLAFLLLVIATLASLS